MFLKRLETDEKYDDLCELSDDALIERICSFPNQDMLNKDMNGNPRKLQVGLTAEQYKEKPLDNATRNRLRQAFSSITTMAVGMQDRPNMPDNVLGYDLWNFDQGGNDGKRISFGLTEEAPGKIAVSVPTTDLSMTKIGYLDEQFVNAYSIHGDRIADGQWHKGKIEILLDAEELYAESTLKPALTNDGEHVYEMPFTISNLDFETSSWNDRGNVHEPNPQIVKTFEENMNAFPVKDMIGDLLAQSGLENPITDVTWQVDGDPKLQITSDKPLDGSQLLCAENALDYLTRESAFRRNQDRHVFGKYMDMDDEFLKAVQGTFETRMCPSLDDLLALEGHLAEVKKESNLVLTDADLVGLGETNDMSL